MHRGIVKRRHMKKHALLLRERTTCQGLLLSCPRSMYAQAISEVFLTLPPLLERVRPLCAGNQALPVAPTEAPQDGGTTEQFEHGGVSGDTDGDVGRGGSGGEGGGGEESTRGGGRRAQEESTRGEEGRGGEGRGGERRRGRSGGG
eukprot:TRINITY_DN2_c0_g2_i1.p2 TRINITY_DN2_c0_g2~~TRINITY_DN2_c0_g2_i1.p2  ORF type:complete len:146 (+),score=27.63 TRINITY_DN2_c0_g2_i1:3-440(+)